MLNFLFLVISLIHQLTTAKVQRRFSEGLAKDERRIIPPHILRYTLWQTFRVCQSFLYPQFKIHNSKFIIHNSPNSHCKIFAKVGKIPPPPIVKIMLNFTIHNVKISFLVISLIHQLTTPKDERRFSEG